MWFIFLDFFPTRFLIVGCSYVNARKFQKYIGIDHNLASLWGKSNRAYVFAPPGKYYSGEPCCCIGKGRNQCLPF
jgi:hypothetical protein